MNPSPVALEDIAKNLELAVSTVSRALRDLPGIHPTTRTKILREAKAMGYVAPRKRRNNDPQVRNVLTLTIGTEVPSSYLAGMSQASLLFNFSLLSHHFPRAESHRVLDPKYQPLSLKMGHVSAIALIYPWPEEIAAELSRKWPTASIIVHYPGLPIDLIGLDHVSGMISLVEHLLATGHRQIGFFGLNGELTWSRSRFGAYMEAQVKFGQIPQMENVISIENPHQMAIFPFADPSVCDQAIQRIKQGVRAWICPDDTTAYSLCAELTRRGIRIPEDVAVVGFHRHPLSISTLPDLTTTKVQEELLGASLLRRLAYRLDHLDEGPHSILFPCQFHQGQTTLDPVKSA